MSEQTVTGTGDAVDVFSVLPRRLPVLEYLEGEPRSKRELVAATDVSRTTIDRATRELEALGLVAYEGGTYALTPLGEVVVDDIAEFLEHVAIAERLEPFLRCVPLEELDLDLGLLADAELVLPDDGDPYAMINRHVERLKGMDTCRSLLPFTGLHATEAGTRRIREGASGVVVAEQRVVETFRTDPQYAEPVEAAAATGRFEVHEYDGDIPYGLSVFDDAVQLVVAERGEPRALLESEHPEVREWARRTFEACREEATPVALS